MCFEVLIRSLLGYRPVPLDEEDDEGDDRGAFSEEELGRMHVIISGGDESVFLGVL